MYDFFMVYRRPINLKRASCFLLLLIPIAVSVLIYSYGMSGNDFWWHIKVGEWICKNNAIPNTDIFSWYGINNHIPWHSQEWLADVIFYVVYNFFGEKGFFLFCVFLETVFVALIILCNYSRIEKRFLFSVIFLCFTSVCFTVFIYGRPHVFSGILLYSQLYCLYKYYLKGKIKHLVPVPVFTVLWSNLHGGSSNLSYILCFVFFLISLFPFKSYRVVNLRKNTRIKVSLLIVTLICVAAIFVNPQGVYVFVYPYVNMSNSFMLSVISEWGSPDAKELGQVVLYFFPLLVFLLCVVLGKRKLLLIDGIIILIFLLLFLRSIRFVFYFFIIISVLGYKYFPVVKIRSSIFGSVFTIILSLIFIVYSFGSLFNELKSNKIIKRVLDTKYCELIKNDNVKRIYNDYNYAETLIYNDIKCFADARVDLFADNIFEDSINLCYLTNLKSPQLSVTPKVIFDKYKFDAVIIQTNRPLKAYLDSNPDEYSLIESDKNTAYYHVNKYYINN